MNTASGRTEASVPSAREAPSDQEVDPIGVFEKDRHAAHAAGHDVAERTIELDPRRPTHVSMLSRVSFQHQQDNKNEKMKTWPHPHGRRSLYGVRSDRIAAVLRVDPSRLLKVCKS